MFGSYRTILALIVVLQHFGGIKQIGTYAVFGFFCLSGFLMTLLMDTTYNGRARDFAINRFLRLYPTYWFTVILVVALYYLRVPPTRGDIGIPTGWELLRALLYINHWKDSPTFITTGWAVTNEIFWYVAIAFGISKTPQRALVWLATSILFTIGVQEYTYGSSDLRYFSPLAGALPFAYGATLYHFKHILSEKFVWPAAIVCIVVMIISLASVGMGWSNNLSKYAFVVAAGVFAVALFVIGKTASRSVRKKDNAIGDLSYPIYLNHYAAASLVLAFSPYHFDKPTLFIPVVILSVIMSYLTNIVMDRNINKIRDAVRLREHRSADTQAAVSPS